MATRYWVGGGSSANWNATGNTNWGTATATQDNASVPGAGDDVIFDSGYTGSCTASGQSCNNMTVSSGYTGTITNASGNTFSIYGNISWASGWTFTNAGEFVLKAPSGTVTILTNGISVGGVIKFGVTGSTATFQLQDNYTTSASQFYLVAGSGTSFDPQTYSFTLTNANPTIGGVLSFYTLNMVGTAVKTNTLTLTTNITVTNTFNIDGNSSINRVLFTSNTLGTARTLTLTGATVTGCTNVDFRDITFTSTGAMDFTNGGANWIGDCGGNTSAGGGTATFTTADDWYFYDDGAGTFNFSDYTQWYTATGGTGSQMASTRCVLPQDNANFDASSINGSVIVDQDMPRVCKTLDFTGVDAMAFHMNNVNQTIYGSLVFASNVTLTSTTSYYIIFEGRDSYVLTPTVTSGMINTYIYMIGGTLRITSNFTAASSYGSIVLAIGTLDCATNDPNITTGSVSISGSATRRLDMGDGTWTCQYIGNATHWNAGTTTLLTFNANGSTLVVGGSSGTVGFAGGSLTYNNVTIATGTGDCTITGSNSFATFTINAPKTVKFTAGTTQTVSSFVATGTGVNPITIASVTGGSVFYLIDTTGTNTVSYCTISDSYVRGNDAGGGALWDASDGTNVDSSNNEDYNAATNRGWAFTLPSATPSSTPSATPSATPSNTPSSTPSATGGAGSNTPSGTPSGTPSATASATPSNTPSSTPSASATPSNTPSATPSSTPSASATPSNTPSATSSGTPSGTPSATASATPSSTPSASATPSSTPSSTPSNTPSASPSGTALPNNTYIYYNVANTRLDVVVDGTLVWSFDD